MKTKKLFPLLALSLLMGLFFTACSDNDDPDVPDENVSNYIKLNNLSIPILESDGESCMLQYYSEDDCLVFEISVIGEGVMGASVAIVLSNDQLESEFTMQEGTTPWSCIAAYGDITKEDPLFMIDGNNKEMNSIKEGTILIRDLGENQFDIHVKALRTDLSPFELRYKGVIDPSV